MRSVTGVREEDISHVRTAANGDGSGKRKCVDRKGEQYGESKMAAGVAKSE